VGDLIGRRRLLALAAALGLAGAAPVKAGPKPAMSRDLSGTWTHAWYTRLQRPKAFKALVATAAEAEAFEAPRRDSHGEIYAKEDELGQAQSEFPDNGPGLARIRGEIRSSWITDPADGRIPWRPGARKRADVDAEEEPNRLDGVEQRPTDERCLTASGNGAPLLNAHDSNVLQLVLTRDHLAIVSENNHGVRIVRIVADAAAPRAAEPPAWFGHSLGHWEDATLVVETAGFRPGFTKIADDLVLSDQARVVERFTRTGPAEITYAFEVADPSLFTRPFRGEMVWRPAAGLIYEYACHEGNYSLPGILSAARQTETATAR
jgi:hypothetical protein